VIMKPGENLQRLVRALEQATNNNPNVKVESPKRMPDKDTGRLREHDVVLTFSLSHHTIVMALECRDRSRKVGVPDVEAFRKKCDRTGIDRAIMVSATGFAKTALKKADACEVGCLGLEEADRFNWCQAPGIEWFDRDLLPGPAWELSPNGPFDGSPQLYDEQGRLVDAAGFTNIAQKALSLRPSDEAQREDRKACTNPVLCSFENGAASSFYLMDWQGKHVPLTRMVMHILYKARYTLIPFQFRTYIDHCKGKQLYTLAIASIKRGGIDGDLVLHHDGGCARVSFVPRNENGLNS
jgi:Restriction endonuclease